MNQLTERIAQFRKMASEDPDNALGHYRLGQLLLETGELDDAAASFRRTLELDPQFSKVYQLLGDTLIKQGKKDAAIKVLTDGYAIADERGDNIPREGIAKLLVGLGQPAPTPNKAGPSDARGPGDGFRCRRPGCAAGKSAHKLAKPPMSGELGQKIFAGVCDECWNYWLKDLSIKVINEMRLDLSTDQGAEMYDNIMRETLGLE